MLTFKTISHEKKKVCEDDFQAKYFDKQLLNNEITLSADSLRI